MRAFSQNELSSSLSRAFAPPRRNSLQCCCWCCNEHVCGAAARQLRSFIKFIYTKQAAAFRLLSNASVYSKYNCAYTHTTFDLYRGMWIVERVEIYIFFYCARNFPTKTISDVIVGKMGGYQIFCPS